LAGASVVGSDVHETCATGGSDDAEGAVDGEPKDGDLVRLHEAEAICPIV
jgi:hypothetical protein